MPSPGVLDLARALPRDAFTKVHGDPFLVVIDTGDDEPPSSFETVDAPHRPSGVVERGVEVHAVVKAKGNPYPDRILIGRAPNCDVVLRYASVSKLHAYFERRVVTLGDPQRVPQTPPDGGLDLVDVGSQSGTRVNGRRLAPNQPAPVAVGAIVVFGRVAGRLVGAAAVWDLLRAQDQMNSA